MTVMSGSSYVTKMSSARSGDITRSSDSPQAESKSQITRPRDDFADRHVQADRIDVRIEVWFSRVDPPEGRVARVSGGEGGPPVAEHAFVGWLNLLSLLQILMGEEVEPHRL